MTELDSTDGPVAEVAVRFNCKAEYVRHEPQARGDRLRIYLDPTGICNGVSPLVAESRSRLRPVNADSAKLLELEYEGDTVAGAVLTLVFSESVDFEVNMPAISFDVGVRVSALTNNATASDSGTAPDVAHRQVERPAEVSSPWAVNLVSLRRIPTLADAPNLQLNAEQRLYYTEVNVDGTLWYRLRLGDFDSDSSAINALAGVRNSFPGAWVDQVKPGESTTEMLTARSMPSTTGELNVADGGDKVDSLMEDARKAMIAGERSQAIQIYTKVLQLPEHSRLPEAQEYLALAREKNGQTAHAKAEYQRYLSLYPDSEGAVRVSQRLAALLASNRPETTVAETGGATERATRAAPSDWRLQTYFSQYYRRDVNQPNDQDEIVSQSALYSDVNFDARRRGERFDFGSRISAGYRNDFINDGSASGDFLRVSYAYADLADAATGLRGRIGRQSRNNGGVLGRFDGLNLGYEAGEQFLINAVVGKPAYSSTDGIDSARTFYGASVDYRPPIDGMELGLFYLAQDIEGISDRQAVGGEFRYFGENQNVWAMVDYDISYNEVGSAFFQGSWRFASRFSIHGSFDRRHSPFLSTGNALIGQPVLTFAELLEVFPVEEIQQFALDRSPLSTTYTMGFSHSLSPRLQINADVGQSTIEATPESGGVFATPESIYDYVSGSLVASSLFKEGDVTIVTARLTDSGTARVVSLSVDSRYPLGSSWRVNPRLRVDRRERVGITDYEWLYTPAIRIQYRRSQKLRFELEAGKQFAQQDSAELNLDRESYFLSLGYQWYF